MKKLVLLSVFICHLMSLAAQNAQFYYGPRAGFGKSIWDNKPGWTNELRADSINGKRVSQSLTHSGISGLSMGFVVGSHLNEWLDLQVRLAYNIGSGNKAEQSESNSKWVTQDGKRIQVIGFDQYVDKFNTLQMDLLARIQPIRSYRFGFLVGLGPSFNFLTKGRGTKTVITATDEYNVSDSPLKLGNGKTDDYDNLDVAVVVNPSVFVNLDRDGFLRLVLDAKFEWGTRDMFNEDRREFLRANNIDVLGTQKWRSTSLALTLEVCPWRKR